MMATTNSDAARNGPARGENSSAARGLAARAVPPSWIASARWLILAVLLIAQAASAQTTAAPGERMKDYYRRLYVEGRKRNVTETNSVEAAWHFARACFDWADLTTTDA